MSRSHIHNTYAPSTPINPFAPASPRPRDSGIGAIGKLLSTPYDTNDESDADDAIIPKLHSDTKQPVDRSGPRVSQVASAVVQSIKSPEGDVHVHADHQHRAYGRQPVSLPFPNVQHNQDYGSYTYTQSSNNIAPTSGLGLSSSAERQKQSDTNLQAGYCQSAPIQSHTQLTHSNYPPIRNVPLAIITGLIPPRSILLPAPASPISPLLAAPPQAHYSPFPSPSSPHPSPYRPPPSSFPSTPRHNLAHARASSTSESMRGFDLLAEKKAFFREGEEELMTPFSPRPRNKPSALRNGMRASGADFWKRFNVSVRLDEIDKQKGPSSDWLSKAQANRRILKKTAWSSALMASLNSPPSHPFSSKYRSELCRYVYHDEQN
ncbi:hypothetical protein LQV05_003782 [Cryptococcus neoformans]|nr:hypothetical protein J007_03061 [Cryptococcus neoformans var. grubii]OXC61380.1 hypothetical protein C358_03145 [Cryptococcus neoformans var. grubii MW-RSA852]UOH81119.1 hypothetical protein LQV05_003782 [Cryptococcus neoformans]